MSEYIEIYCFAPIPAGRCHRHPGHSGEHAEATPEGGREGLDAAWKEAEVAVPERWDVSVGSNVRNDGLYFAVATGPSETDEIIATADTPAAALRALAAQIQEGSELPE